MGKDVERLSKFEWLAVVTSATGVIGGIYALVYLARINGAI